MKSLLFLALLLVVPAWGQGVAGPKNLVPIIQSAAKGLPTAGWNIIVIPYGAWNKNAFIQPSDSDHEPRAYSDLKTHVTYLRSDLTRLAEGQLRRILAHECGHLVLNTSDETVANKWAEEWLRSHSPKVKA